MGCIRGAGGHGVALGRALISSEGFFCGLSGWYQFRSRRILLALLLARLLPRAQSAGCFPAGTGAAPFAFRLRRCDFHALPSMWCGRFDFFVEVWFVIYCYVKHAVEHGIMQNRGASPARGMEGDPKSSLLCRLSRSSWIKGFGDGYLLRRTGSSRSAQAITSTGNSSLPRDKPNQPVPQDEPALVCQTSAGGARRLVESGLRGGTLCNGRVLPRARFVLRSALQPCL